MKKQNTTDGEVFKKKLEQELTVLETELKTVGHKNPNNPKDWEASSGEVDINASDLADIADNIESYESNTAILKPLEKQYNDVKSALAKIKNDTYGFCEICEKVIERERLSAIPSARTCVAHKDQVRN
ncbi:MAG: hypothetical protein Q7R72_02550 [bacterium]|nr:hypothetical protein [bacterium]